MYAVLGWVNVAAVIVLTAPFWLRMILMRGSRSKNIKLLRFIKALRSVHKPLGLVLVATAIVHGILALGALRLHTGTVLAAMLVVTAVLGGVFFRTKKKPFLIAHRAAAVLMVLLVLVHLIFPSALWQLFRI